MKTKKLVKKITEDGSTQQVELKCIIKYQTADGQPLDANQLATALQEASKDFNILDHAMEDFDVVLVGGVGIMFQPVEKASRPFEKSGTTILSPSHKMAANNRAFRKYRPPSGP